MRLQALFVLLLLTLAAACGRTPSSPGSSPYTLAGLRAPHERIDGHVRTSSTVVLVSFFIGGRMGTMQNCMIYHDGTRGMVRFVKNWAVQGSGLLGHAGPMPAAQRSALDAALGALPASQPFAHDADAFLVSWDEGGKWITRTYDRTRLPPEVLKLCGLVGIPSTWL